MLFSLARYACTGICSLVDVGTISKHHFPNMATGQHYCEAACEYYRLIIWPRISIPAPKMALRSDAASQSLH